jgi:hypothetical protein
MSSDQVKTVPLNDFQTAASRRIKNGISYLIFFEISHFDNLKIKIIKY